MKPYRKPIMAVDSDRIIVIDDNVKEVSFTRLGLTAVSIVILLFLTTYGCAVGLNTEIVSRKLESINLWADQPGNQVVIFFFLVAVFGTSSLAFGMWALWFRKK